MKTLLNLPASICVVALILLSNGPSVATAQHNGNILGRPMFVDSNVNQLAVVVGSTQRLKFPYKVPELLVSDQDIVKADPIAPSEILVTGLKPGLTTITVSDPEKNLQTITIEVTTDTRKLEAALKRHFPDSNIRVHALQTGVILKGTVARADQIQHCRRNRKRLLSNDRHQPAADRQQSGHRDQSKSLRSQPLKTPHTRHRLGSIR